MPTDHGPFESEGEARMVPAVRAVYEAFRAGKGRLDCAPLVFAACEAAGVELGDYDARIVAWLGNWEPQTCAVFAGLIHRAHEAGRASAMEGAAIELLKEALHLRMTGERAPGGNETWVDWDRRTERYLRGLLPPETGE